MIWSIVELLFSPWATRIGISVLLALLLFATGEALELNPEPHAARVALFMALCAVMYATVARYVRRNRPP
jgi:cytochrome c-type biogenesis protein CcmH/NrfG